MVNDNEASFSDIIIRLGAIFIILLLLILCLMIVSSKIMKNTKITQARMEITTFNAGIKAYFENCKVYPTIPIGLKGLIKNPGIKGWKVPFISWHTSGIFYDPWNTEYKYRLIKGNPFVSSAGPDKIHGNSDDIH